MTTAGVARVDGRLTRNEDQVGSTPITSSAGMTATAASEPHKLGSRDQVGFDSLPPQPNGPVF